MKKKATINTVIALAILSIFLIVFILAFFGRGLLPKVAEAAINFADDAIGDLRAEKSGIEPLEADPELSKTFDKIINLLTIEDEGPCIYEYDIFPKDFKDYTISFSWDGEEVFAQLINKDGRPARTKTLTKVKTCVVGEGVAAINFYDNYLDGTVCGEGECKTDYSIVSIIFKDNKKIIVNNVERDFKDQNLVYKTRDGNVCFFPTSNVGRKPRGIFKCEANTVGLGGICLRELANREKPILSFCGDDDE